MWIFCLILLSMNNDSLLFRRKPNTYPNRVLDKIISKKESLDGLRLFSPLQFPSDYRTSK